MDGNGPAATFQSQASPCGNPLAVSKSMMALVPAAPVIPPGGGAAPVIPPGGGAAPVIPPRPRARAAKAKAMPSALAKALAKPASDSSLCHAWLSFKVSKAFELVVTVIPPSPPDFVGAVADAQKGALESMLNSDCNQEITGTVATVLNKMKLIKDELRLKAGGWLSVPCSPWSPTFRSRRQSNFVKIGTALKKKVMTGRRSHVLLFGHWP